jgi:hypothetical protein
MKNKYYKPEIEEFHVGFEYEFWVDSENGKDVYEKRIFQEYDEPYYHKNGSSTIVKHLDREDIEDCGFGLGISSWDRNTHEREVIIMEPWKLVSEQTHFELVINEQNVWQIIFGKTIRIVHATLSDEKIGFMIIGEPLRNSKHYMKFDTVFNGAIKNKSEFKRILRQIGVEVE